MQYLHSIAAYADHILDYETLPHDIEDINNLNDTGQWVNHRSTLARAFRNEFGLCDPNHPLTKNWHQNEASRVIHNGIDFSADHPDAVSMRIIEAYESKILVNPLKRNTTIDYTVHTSEGSVNVINGIVNPLESI